MRYYKAYALQKNRSAKTHNRTRNDLIIMYMNVV